MEQVHPTTPFGRRPLTLAMVASQVAAKACPPEAVAHKWQLFREITEAKAALGVSDRALAVLNALLTFHPETALTPGSDLIVWPSNAQLALRTHGMAEKTLRRHLAVLVDVGLIIRRDSPNGKRYARKGQGGSVESAFGFDLTPLVARTSELERLAEQVRGERRALALRRERITLLRRDIAKMIALGVEDELPGDWPTLHEAFLTLSWRLPREPAIGDLDQLASDLTELAATARKLLETHVETQELTGNDGRDAAHYQNSNTDPLESELSFRGSQARPAEPEPEPVRPASKGLPLGLVLQACPDIVNYARNGISNWRDFVATAAVVRSVYGISPSAWADACETMGEGDAATVVAAILQRGDAIKSAGGYLRSLTEKARAGKFSTGPIIMSLWRARTREPMRA